MNLSFLFNYFIILKQFTLFPLLLRIRNEVNALETKKRLNYKKQRRAEIKDCTN